MQDSDGIGPSCWPPRLSFGRAVLTSKSVQEVSDPFAVSCFEGRVLASRIRCRWLLTSLSVKFVV